VRFFLSCQRLCSEHAHPEKMSCISEVLVSSGGGHRRYIPAHQIEVSRLPVDLLS
jgi:hypothetical protein